MSASHRHHSITGATPHAMIAVELVFSRMVMAFMLVGWLVGCITFVYHCNELRCSGPLQVSLNFHCKQQHESWVARGACIHTAVTLIKNLLYVSLTSREHTCVCSSSAKVSMFAGEQGHGAPRCLYDRRPWAMRACVFVINTGGAGWDRRDGVGGTYYPQIRKGQAGLV